MTRDRERRRRDRHRTLRDDDRGASISLNYTLSLVIVSMLISGLFIGMNTFLQNERTTAVRSEFDVLGNRLAADIAAADRLATTAEGPDAAVAVRTKIPGQVAGVGYEITIVSNGADPDGDGTNEFYDVTIYLDANGLGVNESVSVKTAHRVTSAGLAGGSYVVTLDGSTLEVQNG